VLARVKIRRATYINYVPLSLAAQLSTRVLSFLRAVLVAMLREAPSQLGPDSADNRNPSTGV